jgi:L,D-transpeptidase ErfK/SrfK
MKIKTAFVFLVLLLSAIGYAYATTYALPENSGDTVITEYFDDMPFTVAEKDETLLDIAREFELGQMEIVRLNRELDRWDIKKGEVVRIANKRILPDSPHKGITLNLPEYRLYYYPPVSKGQPQQVMSFAIGVGRMDWKTPLGKTSVTKKVKDPSWYPPESIRQEHAEMGDPLPEVVPPGLHNPLGAFALHLNLPGDYRIHGTDIDKIYGIGMQITHGCIRLYPENIEELYNQVSVGTPVYIVKQPVKAGWLDNWLYIEAHPDLEGDELSPEERYDLAMGLIQKANNGIIPDINQVAFDTALKDLTGDPVPIFERIPLPPEEEIMPMNQNEPSNPVPPVDHLRQYQDTSQTNPTQQLKK